MGTLGDLLVLGEGPSIVADADVDLLGVWCGWVCRTLESEIKLCFLGQYVPKMYN